MLENGKTGLLHENDDFIHHGGVAPHLNPVHSKDIEFAHKATSQHEMVLVGHESFLTDLAWCEADRYLISTSGDSSTILWDVEMQTKLLSLGGHSDDINCVALSPKDNRVFVTAGQDGRCLVWDTRINMSVAERTSGVSRESKHWRMSPLLRGQKVPSSSPLRMAMLLSTVLFSFLMVTPF